MRSALLTLLAFTLFSVNSSAQGFNGAYALTNWTQTLSANQGISSNTGSFNISNPNEVIIFGSNDPENDFAPGITTSDFSIIATTSGIWSFQWEYHTDDVNTQPEFDDALVLVDDGAISSDLITTPSGGGGGIDQSGTFTSPLAVVAGNKITIRVRSVDNVDGAARIRIFNFVEPGGSTLPVQMSLFNAKQSGEQVKLDWATQSESNSDRFEVERSTNGKDFKVIATIRAAGNSTLTQNYSAIDNNPENGNNYYRLRQVDLDGKFTYSMIKTLKWSTIELVKLYPNPVRNMVNVRFTPERNETTAITLFDGSGKTLQRRNIAAVAGSNMVTAWNVEGLAPGIYFFRINGISAPLRFVKQ